MGPIGIVRNPKSRRNRALPSIDAARLGEGVLLREPATHAELDAVCAEFAARGVGILAVDGGDGTVRDTLSAAREAFPVLPPLAFLASGKTNILAANTGSWGTGEAALVRLAATGAETLLRQPRKRLPTLDLSAGGRRLIGFVFGAGAYSRAVALADEGAADRIRFGPARIAAGIGRALLKLGHGEERERWRRGTPMHVAVDGRDDPATRARFILLATTLERFTIGLWPFWNDDGRALRWLDIDAPPRRFAAALLPVLRGRPKPWMAAAGYRSGSADHLTIWMDAPFVLDGEAFAPGPDGLVTLASGPPVEFVLP